MSKQVEARVVLGSPRRHVWNCPACGVGSGGIRIPVELLPEAAEELRRYRCRSCANNYTVIISYYADEL